MRAPRRRPLLLSPALAALLALWPSVAHPQPADAARGGPDRRASLSGTWQLEPPPERARALVSEAIDRAVGAMNFFVRGIARWRLREGTPVHEQIALRLRDDDRITVIFDGRETYTTELGRTEGATNPKGEPMRVTQRFRPDGSLEQSFEAGQGTRRYVYTPRADGRLRVTTVTESSHMPQPMSFVLDYRRR